jgi:protein gp37
LNKPIPPGINDLLWDLVRETPYLTWIFLVDNPSTRLPSDWGNGFGNVALGVQVKSRKHSIDLVDALRRTPAQLRFLEALPFDEDFGEFDFYGFDLLIENNSEKKSIQQTRWFRKFEDQFALHCKVAPLWDDLNRIAMDPFELRANGAT